MEILLLWLDELEDGVFAVALVWEPLRRSLLRVGLGAAAALHWSQAAASVPGQDAALAAVACSSVLVWAVAALLPLARSRARGSNAAVA